MKKILQWFQWQKMISPEQIVGEMPTNKEIYQKTFNIAWPSAVESILIALIYAVDMMMVGSLGAESISAVGITNQPKFFMLAPILALNIAVTVLVSRRKGEGKQESANNYLRQAFVICIIASLCLSLLGAIFAEPFLMFAGANEDYIQLAVNYFRIIMIGNFFQCMSLTMTAAQRGAGNTKISMVTNIAANIVNLFFNVMLIHGLLFFPKLGVNGAAIATMIGNIVAFSIATYSLTKKGGFLNLKLSEFKGFDAQTMKDIKAISLPSLVEQGFLRFGFLMYAKSVAGLGTLAFAAHNVCMQMMSISFSFGDGISIANTSLVGQSLGQKRPDMAMVYAKISQRAGICVATLLMIFISLNRVAIVGLFTNDAQVIMATEIPMIILSITVLFQIPQVIVVGSLRGAGDVRFVAMLMLISVSIVRPVLAYLLSYPLGLGLLGAWLALLLDQITRNVLSSFRFKQNKWTKIKV